MIGTRFRGQNRGSRQETWPDEAFPATKLRPHPMALRSKEFTFTSATTIKIELEVNLALNAVLSHANEPLVFEVQLLKVVGAGDDPLSLQNHIIRPYTPSYQWISPVPCSPFGIDEVGIDVTRSPSSHHQLENLSYVHKIFLWDWRTKKQIVCLEESHTVDVTQVLIESFTGSCSPLCSQPSKQASAYVDDLTICLQEMLAKEGIPDSSAYRFAQIMWRLSPIGYVPNMNENSSVLAWFDNVIANKLTLLTMILWRIWKCRNVNFFNGENVEPQLAMYMAIPGIGILKLNVDGEWKTVANPGEVAGAGMVVRNSNGDFVAARACHLGRADSALSAEALAWWQAI
ncbi:hypothetical protein RHSIM_Rhsim04G0118100 [Rhododendron simsii]|uniref:RNase H type-1 domain-containing protein n=1 Tax=Rhododendron simsii TaxID=118357 RepID=A0A834H1M7_RHOSS|nr:hypothetical protein RHSIM_Rhsim04G0118100 [Rhododendron simsii]